MSKKTIIIAGSCAVFGLIMVVIALMLNNKTYKVYFDTKGGSNVSTQEVKSGGKVSKPVNPTKKGYEFIGWIYNNKLFDFTTKVNQDMTLVAKWEEEKTKYNVELEVDGKKQTLEIKEGELIKIDKLTFEEKEGYEIEWTLDGEKFDIETTKITSNISLVGKYVEVKTYIVTFDTDGGSKIQNQKVNENKTVKEPTEPTKDGYVFDAWYLDNKKYDFKEKVTKDITLKAKWNEDKNTKKYTVTFNSDGGSDVAKQSIMENKTVTKPSNPTKNGYSFVEWQLNGKTYDFNNKVTKDITLKAVWKQVITYTVKFNSLGGNVYQNQTVESGGKATNPGNPSKNGYVFTGWDFDFNTPITQNITIRATWRELYKYTVQFNLNGGTCANNACTNQIITEGGKATNPGNPTRGGFTFNGWDYDFTNVVTGDLTINAKWNEIVYKIEASPADKYSTDLIITVKNGNTVVTNYQCVSLSESTDLCIEGNRISKSSYERENSFYVIFADGTRIRATK